MLRLKNKIALITGGTSGIGKEIAKAFAGAGATVIILGTNPDRAQEVLKELEERRQASEQQFFAEMVNVASTAEVEVCIKKLLEKLGRIDILVNNAGVTRDNLLMKMSEEEWDTVIDVNLKSVYNTCQVLIRPMIKAKSGKIINISSVVGLTGNAGQVNYAASKSGMIGFTKALAQEVATRGVRVNCIAPGFIETRMTDALNETQKEGILKKIPMGRLGTPEDIAKAALFLASDDSDYITGQVITVDGGMVM